MLGITTQRTGVFSVTRVGVSTVSMNIEHDTNGLVFVGHELVILPFTDEGPFWSAGVRQGARVCRVSINSVSKTEGGLLSFTMDLQFFHMGHIMGKTTT